jgi:hypothetical protein
MRLLQRLSTVLLPATCLLLMGCEDCIHPLSDPQAPKAEPRLIGMWREQTGDGDVTYYHVGRAGENFPDGVLRIVTTSLKHGELEPPDEYLAFATALADSHYLNVVIDDKQVRLLDAKGWKPETIDCYTLVKYELAGDKLTVWAIDETAKEQAIKTGKIKGVVVENSTAKFSDTSEAVARFVTQAGDSLWNLKEPGRLQRVEESKNP